MINKFATIILSAIFLTGASAPALAHGSQNMTSASCAVAIAVAVSDFEKNFPDEGPTLYSGVLRRFASVECVERDDGIQVLFEPRAPQKRGGDVSYLIDKQTYSVIERVLGR